MKVEKLIEAKYGMPFDDVIEVLLDKGMNTEQIANQLDLSVANLRRIARKNKISLLTRPKAEEIEYVLYHDDFISDKINILNFLSRIW